MTSLPMASPADDRVAPLLAAAGRDGRRRRGYPWEQRRGIAGDHGCSALLRARRRTRLAVDVKVTGSDITLYILYG